MGYNYVFALSCLILVSCAVPQKPAPSYHSEFNTCLENEKTYQENLERLEKELAAKNEKLRSLGLLDKDGSLKFTVQSPPKSSTGKESWQK